MSDTIENIADGTHYFTYGDISTASRIVCCVHGIGGDCNVFKHIAPHLSNAGFAVVRYDLIGRGKSLPHASEKFGADAHIDQLYQLLTNILQLSKPVDLVAHSMGGSLATLFTSKYPAMVRSLVLLSPAGLMDAGPLPLLRRSNCIAGMIRNSINNPKKQEKAWRSGFYKHTGVHKEREDAMVAYMHANNNNAGSFQAFWQSALQFPLFGIDNEAKSVSQFENLHVFLLFARKDTMVPFKPSYKRWCSVMESGRVKFESKILENCGHTFPLEEPDETNAAVLECLNKVIVVA